MSDVLDQRWRLALAIGVLAVLAAYVVWPQLGTMAFALGLTGAEGEADGGFGAVLASGIKRAAVINSVLLSAGSVVLAGLLGSGAAIVHERLRFPGRALVLLAAVLPFSLPPLVGVMAFARLVGHGGMIPRLLADLTGLSATRFVLADWPGILLVHAYSFSVYFFVLVRAGLQQGDHTSELAARSLGAPLLVRWWRVTLPGLFPYLLGAALLAFMVSMGSYSAPRYMTSGKPYLPILTVEIAYSYESGRYREAAVLASILAAVSLAVLAAMQALGGAAVRRHGGGTKGEGAELLARPVGGPAGWLLGCGAAIFLLAMSLPLLSIAVTSLADMRAWNAAGSVLPPRWTLANFQGILARRGAFMHPALVSIFSASAATLLNVAMAVASAWLVVRGKPWQRWAVDTGSMLPLALPGTVVAINTLLAFGMSASPLTLGVALRGTFTILALVYFLRQIPLALRPLVAALSRLSPVHEAASRSLGAGPAATFRRVVLPQLRLGILAAALICFVSGLGEFVASVLASSTRWRPISIEIASALSDSEGVGPAAAYAGLLMMLTIGSLVVYRWLTERK